MTGPQLSTQINLDSGLSDLLKPGKTQTNYEPGNIGGKFLEALDNALKRDNRPADLSPPDAGGQKTEPVAKSPVQDAAPVTANSPKNEQAPEDSTKIQDKPANEALARALKVLQMRENTSGTENLQGRKTPDAKTRKTTTQPGTIVAVDGGALAARMEKDAGAIARGKPGLNRIEDTETAPRSRNVRSKDHSAPAKTNSDEVVRSKDRKKTRLEGLETVNAQAAGLLQQNQENGRNSKVQPASDDASRNLLGKAIDTLKNLGAQLGSQKPEFNVRELIPSDLMGRLSGKKNEKSEGLATGNRSKSPVSMSVEKEDGGRVSTGKARAGRNGDDLARRVEIQDQRGASLAAGSIRNFVQAQDVLAQAATGAQASKGKSSSVEGPGLDLSVNTAYVPARERVIQMPVMPSAQGGFGQSLRDWMEGKGGQHIANEAKMLLKDGGTGEIKLILHPEEMGEVRINLKLQDGHIAGDIFVENEEVRKAFQDQLQSLGEAFRQSGFGDSQFTVALGQQGGQGRGSNPEPGQEDKRQVSAYALEKLERQVTVLPSTGYGNSQIDMVV